MRFWLSPGNCSPALTPIALHAVGFMTTGDYSEDLHELAKNGARAFLGVWVILPSLSGILAHRLGLVASMPIAGASTAWAQNANGNLALSLGLILLTTSILGEKHTALISPYLKLGNFGDLVLLNYSNAALSLPGVVSQPDFDFVIIMPRPNIKDAVPARSERKPRAKK